MTDLNLEIMANDLANNPTTRVPICLALDTSGSMTGEKIRELNQGVKLFFDSLMNDEVTRYSAEVAIVTFGDGGVQTSLDFAFLERQQAPQFNAGGYTPMGAGISKAINLLSTRKRVYSEFGTDYWQPWLVIMTDGDPTDDISQAVKDVVALQRTKKLVVIPLGVGNDARMDILAQFSPQRPPARLKSVNDFTKFFQWLSKSIQRVSNSTSGDGNINFDDDRSWMEAMKEGAKAWSTTF